jgi:hypothetical protein
MAVQAIKKPGKNTLAFSITGLDTDMQFLRKAKL